MRTKDIKKYIKIWRYKKTNLQYAFYVHCTPLGKVKFKTCTKRKLHALLPKQCKFVMNTFGDDEIQV
jgi:hypothetical protein